MSISLPPAALKRFTPGQLEKLFQYEKLLERSTQIFSAALYAQMSLMQQIFLSMAQRLSSKMSGKSELKDKTISLKMGT